MEIGLPLPLYNTAGEKVEVLERPPTRGNLGSMVLG